MTLMSSPCGCVDRKNCVGSASSWNRKPWSAVMKMLVALALASLLHQVDNVAQRVLGGLEDLALGARLVAGGVDPVVVDVQDPVVLEELAPLVGAQCLEVLGLDRRAADPQGSCCGRRCRSSAGRRRARSCASGECLSVECGSSAAMPSCV